MALTVEDVLNEIELIHKRKPLFGCRAWKEMTEGRLSDAQVRELIRQNGIIPLHNHNYHGRLYVHCPDPEWREMIAEVCYEEGTGRLYADGVPHYKLWLRLGEALGVSQEAMWNTDYCAGALAFKDYFSRVCERDFLEGVSAHMLAGEAPVPAGSVSRADALRKQFGLSDDDLAFFTVHQHADTDHTNIGKDLLTRFAKTDDDMQRVLKTVEQTLDVMLLMYDDVYKRLETIG